VASGFVLVLLCYGVLLIVLGTGFPHIVSKKQLA